MQKFEEDPTVNPNDLEIPVNAVATALKTFFQELPTPLVPSCYYDDLMEAASMLCCHMSWILCFSMCPKACILVHLSLNSLPVSSFKYAYDMI